jgi:Saxitoxin biosynthesis operon protein SxtJ
MNKLPYTPRAFENVDSLKTLFHGKEVRVHVYSFGRTFFIILSLIGLWRGFSGHSFLGSFLWCLVGASLWAACKLSPKLMEPIWRGWMKLGVLLGVVVTPLLLGIIWIVMMIPLSLLLRVSGKRLMDTEFRDSSSTFWKSREGKGHAPMDRQY